MWWNMFLSYQQTWCIQGHFIKSVVFHSLICSWSVSKTFDMLLFILNLFLFSTVVSIWGMYWEKEWNHTFWCFYSFCDRFVYVKRMQKLLKPKTNIKLVHSFHHGLQWILAAPIVLTQVQLLNEDSVRCMIISSIVSVFHMQN